jgi:hypothetical protein
VNIAVGVVAVLVLIIVAIVLVGRSLPVGHIASRTLRFGRTPVESVPPKLLVRRVVGEWDFGGTWTCEIAPAPSGSTLTITESGEIYNAFFRFVSRFIIGHHRTIDGTMAALRKCFGES